MHRLLPLLILCFLLQACLGDGTQYIPDDFAPYVEEFFEEARARGHDIYLEDYTLSVVYRELITVRPDRRVGECSWTGQRQIRIDPDHWARADETERRRLMFHELGHCVLLRPHRSVQDDRGLCYSIMNDPRTLPCERNLNDGRWWHHLVDELFDSTLTTLPVWEELNVPYEPPAADAVALWSEQDTAFSYAYGIDNFPVELLTDQNYVVRLTAMFNEARPIVSIGLGELKLSYCSCVFSSVQIYRNQSGDLFSANVNFPEPVVLEIQRRGDEVLFYVNSQFFYKTTSDNLGDLPLPEASYRNGLNYPGRPALHLEVLAWP
ncbi:MAG: hypothetical protein AAF597_17155 [Bacteroidota bacterium]